MHRGRGGARKKRLIAWAAYSRRRGTLNDKEWDAAVRGGFVPPWVPRQPPSLAEEDLVIARMYGATRSQRRVYDGVKKEGGKEVSVRETVIDVTAVASLLPVYVPGPVADPSIAARQQAVIEGVLILDDAFHAAKLPKPTLPAWLEAMNADDPDWLEREYQRLGVVR